MLLERSRISFLLFSVAQGDDFMHLGWFDLVILILASFRLTHLIVFDSITEFIRKPFLDESGQEIIIKGTGIRHFMGKLLSCYWCTGIWSSILVVLLYVYVPVTYPVFLILAVAGAAAFIESKI